VAFVKRHPVLAYYALTFAISWGGLLLVVGGPSGIPGTSEQVTRLLPFVILATYAGPAVAGLLLTGLVSGRAGYRDLLARLLTWRVGARWYALALLTAPLVFAAVFLLLSLASPAFLPGILTTSDKATFLLIGTLPALLVGVFEEVGWTGFVTPRLRQHRGVLTTGLIVGVLWGAWHVPAMALWAGAATAGAMPLALFITVRTVDLLLGQLVPYRVLMVWAYDRTGSLLVAVLMHASLTAATWVLAPTAASEGMPMFVGSLGVAAALWVVVATIAVANHGQLSRPPLRTQVA
jgi:membrane protease YdiL (CAAX protease family)